MVGPKMFAFHHVFCDLTKRTIIINHVAYTYINNSDLNLLEIMIEPMAIWLLKVFVSPRIIIRNFICDCIAKFELYHFTIYHTELSDCLISGIR